MKPEISKRNQNQNKTKKGKTKMKTLRYLVVKTAFHGGGVISKHSTENAAIKAAGKWGNPDCTCGCAGVVHLENLENLQEAGNQRISNPYALCR